MYDDSDARWVTWNIQPHFMLTGHNSRDISPQDKNLPPFPPLNLLDVDPRDGRTPSIFERPEAFVYVNFLLGYMDTYIGDKTKFRVFTEIGIGPNASFTPILSNKKLYNSILQGVQTAYGILRNFNSPLPTPNGWMVVVNPPLFGNYSAMGGRER